MFKFDFDLDDIDDEISVTDEKSATQTTQQADYPQEPFREHPITQLLESLPSLISFSPISIPIASESQPLTLVRRDLFDARFQLISEGHDAPARGKETEESGRPGGSVAKHSSTLAYLDAPSDLLPGVYEGGLKTWECSLDLVEYLSEISTGTGGYEGKRIIELGCGTAVPSLYILHRLFSQERSKESSLQQETQIHLQDYNASVLELVTLPNIFLTWYLSPASSSFREAASIPPLDPSAPGELTISDDLKEAFMSSLKENKIQIRFFSGSWDTFDLTQTGGKYNVVLTSETIYREDSLPSLIRLLDEGCDDSLEALASSKLSLDDSVTEQTYEPPYLCLVAAKVLYFGVGGGVSEFSGIIESPTGSKSHRRGTVKTVLEKTSGVGRKVLQIQWL